MSDALGVVVTMFVAVAVGLTSLYIGIRLYLIFQTCKREPTRTVERKNPGTLGTHIKGSNEF